MTNNLRIAFGNKARVGKDSACDYLIEKYGGEKLRFATPVYGLAGAIQDFMGLPRKKDPALLQWVGVGMRQLYGDNVWSSIVRKHIDVIAHNAPSDNGESSRNIFVADMRFINEADMLREAGFVLVRIDRPDRPIDRDPNHISETELDNYKFDYVVENNGSLEAFYRSIEGLMREIKKDKQLASC